MYKCQTLQLSDWKKKIRNSISDRKISLLDQFNANTQTWTQRKPG